MAKVPKASGGDHGNQYTGGKINSSVNYAKSKEEVVAEAGFTPMQVSRFETLAAHPEAVAQAKADKPRAKHPGFLYTSRTKLGGHR